MQIGDLYRAISYIELWSITDYNVHEFNADDMVVIENMSDDDV